MVESALTAAEEFTYVTTGTPGRLSMRACKALGGHHVGHGAAGVRARQQNGFAGGENGGRLGHEMNPAEHQGFGFGLGGTYAEFQRVAAEIGHILDFGRLVVVGQQNGVLLFQQGFNPVLNRFFHNRTP